MDITFAQEFSSKTVLDKQLMSTPASELYWNRGVHPLITINNLLEFLPDDDFTFEDWLEATTYEDFETSRNAGNVVNFGGNIYLSIKGTNLNNPPDAEGSLYWLLTNIESLKIRVWLWTVYDQLSNELNLTRQLIENQFIYNVGDTSQMLSNDWSGWVFEAKNSDYVKIRINEMSLQAMTTDPVDLFVINQGRLIDTIVLNPNNGLLEFEPVNYTISGKGKVYFIFASQEVLSNNAYNTPLKYDSFTCTPVNGVGADKLTAEYSSNNIGNGLNFNVSVRLDSSKYLINNKIDLANALQYQGAMEFLKMAVHNSNSVSGRSQRKIMNTELLKVELYDMSTESIVRQYTRVKNKSIDAINKTFDRFLQKKTGIRVKRGSV
jgi:hypothetical protein